MFKIRSLGLFQLSYTDLFEVCLLYSLPRAESRGELNEDLWNTKQHCLYGEVCCLLRMEQVWAVSALLLLGAWGFTHCTSARGHWPCQSGQAAVKMLSAHSLPGLKEVGKEITPEKAKNYFSLLWCFKMQMHLMYDLIANCRIATLIQMSTTNHKLTHN